MTHDFLTVRQFAMLHGVHPHTIRIAIRKGELKAGTFGNSKTVHRDEPYISRPQGRPKGVDHAARIVAIIKHIKRKRRK